MNDNLAQQLLQSLQHISWLLNEINHKLDTLQHPAATAAAPAKDPKKDAIDWFRAHFIAHEEGDFARFIKQLPLYPSVDDMSKFLLPYCISGSLTLRDCCSTPCARAILALVPRDRKISVENYRRSLSDLMRVRWQIRQSQL